MPTLLDVCLDLEKQDFPVGGAVDHESAVDLRTGPKAKVLLGASQMSKIYIFTRKLPSNGQTGKTSFLLKNLNVY